MTTRRARIGDICTFAGGGTPTKSFPPYYGGSIPWVTPKDMKAWEIHGSQVSITEAGLNNSAARLVPPNSILVVVRSGVLKHTVPIAITRVPVTVNQDMKALVCSEAVNPDYAARFLKSQSSVILQWVRATTADNFPVDKLKQIEIPLPPLPEQRRIAEILDRADALRAKRRAALDQLDTLTQSIFLDMFGDPATNPRGWVKVRLEEVLMIPLRNGISPSHKGGVSAQVLTLSAVTGGAFDEMARKVSTFQTVLPPDQTVDANDFLICRGNGNIQLVGKGRFPLFPMPNVAFPDTMIAARVSSERLEQAFLQQVWNSGAVRRQIESLARTTNGTFKVNQTMLQGIAFVCPPISLQRNFSHGVAAVTRTRSAQRASLATLDRLFVALQHRAFRGEL